jgi:AcrR family transcriptional regulator
VPKEAGANPESGEPALSVVGGAGRTKRLILETAQRLFDDQGYDATSLRQIAEAVGMTKAAVYYHYPAKEHLLLELTRPMLDALGELVTRLRTGAADSEAALAAYLDVFIDHLPVLLLLARDPATQNHPDVGRRVRTLVDAVQKLVAGPDATSDRTVRTACAMGVIHALATLPPAVVSANRDIILDAALAALQPR